MRRQCVLQKMSPDQVWMSVLVLLVVLDLGGLLVDGSLDLTLPSEGKPSSSVSVEEGGQHIYMHMKQHKGQKENFQCATFSHEEECAPVNYVNTPMSKTAMQ